jgi:hypothetical protein
VIQSLHTSRLGEEQTILYSAVPYRPNRKRLVVENDKRLTRTPRDRLHLRRAKSGSSESTSDIWLHGSKATTRRPHTLPLPFVVDQHINKFFGRRSQVLYLAHAYLLPRSESGQQCCLLGHGHICKLPVRPRPRPFHA